MIFFCNEIVNIIFKYIRKFPTFLFGRIRSNLYCLQFTFNINTLQYDDIFHCSILLYDKYDIKQIQLKKSSKVQFGYLVHKHLWNDNILTINHFYHNNLIRSIKIFLSKFQLE